MSQFADHNIKVFKVRGITEYGQKKRIQWKQQNSGQDCVKDQEVDGQ